MLTKLAFVFQRQFRLIQNEKKVQNQHTKYLLFLENKKKNNNKKFQLKLKYNLSFIFIFWYMLFLLTQR